jgi:hypothetical protein
MPLRSDLYMIALCGARICTINKGGCHDGKMKMADAKTPN